jgi:hypothetical protein
MEKRGRGLFPKLVMISIGIIILNLGYLLYRNISSENFNENSIASSIMKIFNLSTSLKIIIIVQIFIIISALSYTFSYERKMKRLEKESIESDIKKASPSQTDLDVLYEILQKKKELGLSAISESFKIEKEIAMEWCKILESGDLATIDYPVFGEPITKIKLNENEHQNTAPPLPEKKEENPEEIKKAINEDLPKIKKRKIRIRIKRDKKR